MHVISASFKYPGKQAAVMDGRIGKLVGNAGRDGSLHLELCLQPEACMRGMRPVLEESLAKWPSHA